MALLSFQLAMRRFMRFAQSAASMVAISLDGRFEAQIADRKNAGAQPRDSRSAEI
tara:strand:+ start:330 stop:494 length:165 start_codon:yes stop_codon:yes gene_type:complete